jgi:hypothetical protein
VLPIGLSGKLFPIHLKPKEDELLSSWLVRLSLAHGLAPEELCSIFSPRMRDLFWRVRDIDCRSRKNRELYDEMLALFSRKSATPLSRVMDTTLDEYDRVLYNRRDTSRLYSWITPQELRPKPYKSRFGMQACIQCLAEDVTPYFRRRWRLSFVIACPRHKSLVIDRCYACGASIRFGACLEQLSRNRLFECPGD